jgi:uncharacterized protein DUF6185
VHRKRAMCLVLATVSVVGLAAPDALAREARVRLSNRLDVDARGFAVPRVRATLAVAVRAREPIVRDLLLHAPRDGQYRRALRWVLDGFGTYRPMSSYSAAFVIPSRPLRAQIPKPTIRRGRARIFLTVSSELSADRGSLSLGLWTVAARHGRITVTTTPARARRGVTLLHTLHVRGAPLTALSPAPDRARPGHQPLRWVQRWGSKPTPVRAEFRLPTHTRLLLASNHSPWSWLHVFFYLPGALLLFVALVPLMRHRALAPAWSDPAARRLRRLTGVALAIALVLMAVDLWSYLGFAADTSSDTQHATQTGQLLAPIALIGAIGVLVASGWRRWLVMLIAVVTLAAAAQVAPAALYDRPRLSPGVQLALAITVALVATTAAALLLAITIRRLWPREMRAGAWAGRAACALLAVVLVGQWLRYEHLRTERFADLERLGYAFPLHMSFSESVVNSVSSQVFAIAFNVGTLLPFVGLAAILAALRERSHRERLPDGPAIVLLILLFAAFVVGTSGFLYTYRLPLAFLVGGGLLGIAIVVRRPGAQIMAAQAEPFLDRRTACLQDDEVFAAEAQTRWVEAPARAERVDWMAWLVRPLRWLVVGLKHVWGWLTTASRGFLPAVAPTERVATRSEPSTAILYGLGPRDTWWDNAVVATRMGGLLGIAPTSYLMYVVITNQHPFSSERPLGPLVLVQVGLFQYASWLVGAFVFGALYAYMPGETGFAKGFTPTIIFALSQAAVEVLPGPFGPLRFSFLVTQLALFYVILGVLLDVTTVRDRGIALNRLRSFYAVDRAQVLLRYGSPLVLALFFFLQQIISGDAEHAVLGLLQAAPSTLPTGPGPAPG